MSGPRQMQEMPEDVAATITSEASEREGARRLEYRRSLKRLEDLAVQIRNLTQTLHGFEDALVGPTEERDKLRKFVLVSLTKQAEVGEAWVEKLAEFETKLRGEFPKSQAPAVRVNKEEWHIKVGFSYPHPTNPNKTVRYGTGEEIPPNLTQADLERFYAAGNIYKYIPGPDGKGLYVPHPKVVQLSAVQITDLMKQPPGYIKSFLTKNAIRLDTLLRMQVAVAQLERHGGVVVDASVKELLVRLIGEFTT